MLFRSHCHRERSKAISTRTTHPHSRCARKDGDGTPRKKTINNIQYGFYRTKTLRQWCFRKFPRIIFYLFGYCVATGCKRIRICALETVNRLFGIANYKQRTRQFVLITFGKEIPRQHLEYLPLQRTCILGFINQYMRQR